VHFSASRRKITSVVFFQNRVCETTARRDAEQNTPEACAPKIFQKSACEIFHDVATLKFSNPQLVWFIEQSVSSEAIFYSEAIQQNLFGLRIFRRDFCGEFECAAG
jgi:hypothetical protein